MVGISLTNMYIDVEFRRETLYKHKLKDNNCLVFTHTHTHTQPPQPKKQICPLKGKPI